MNEDEFEHMEQMALDNYMAELNELLAPAWSISLLWNELPTLSDFLGD